MRHKLPPYPAAPKGADRGPAMAKGRQPTADFLVSVSGRLSLESLLVLFRDVKNRQISLSVLQSLIILYVAEGRELIMRELAEKMGVVNATITTLADTLERVGFAERTSNGLDRRQNRICLTHEGCAYVEWIQEIIFRSLVRSGGKE